MIITVVHGYLLRGTGSNLYVSNLCRAFCRQGHQMLLFSQETMPEASDFISRSEVFTADNCIRHLQFERSTPYPGRCIHYRPHLGGLLPVYVFDHYPGFEVKEFPSLSDTELENYISFNSRALKAIFGEIRPNLVISQHTIMQPVYAARALAESEKLGARHLITVHGSALNYSVKKSNHLRGYALEGISAADGLIFVSSDSRNDFVDYFSDLPGLEKKCRVIFAGVDTSLFVNLNSSGEKKEMIADLSASIKNAISEEAGGRNYSDKNEHLENLEKVSSALEIKSLIDTYRSRFDMWAPDLDIAKSLKEIDWPNERIVLYYGKYLWNKGVHLLLAAAPLVLQEYPQTRFIMVGFGAAREYLETLVGLIDQGRVELALDLIENPLAYDPFGTGTPAYSKGLLRMLSDPRVADRYRDAARGKLFERLVFTGIMDHDQLRRLIPCADVVVAPSIFPESFGLVAVEALASGVLPIQTYHSGFADVVDIYEDKLKDVFTAAGIDHLLLDENLVPALAANIKSLIRYRSQLTEEEIAQVATRAHRLAGEYFSWDKISASYLSEDSLSYNSKNSP